MPAARRKYNRENDSPPGIEPGKDRNSMRIRLPLFSLALLLAALASYADQVIEEIVARVDNQIITRSEYLRSEEELKKEAQQQDPANADRIVADREKDVLRDLIDQQLLLAKGKELGISGDTELVKKLDQMRKDMNLESMEDLEKAAQGQGVSFEDFKQNMRNQIITQQVIGREVGSRITIGKEDEEKFYQEHQSDLDQPEMVRMSEILVSTEKKADDKRDDAAVLAAAQDKANHLLEEIKKGAKFEDVAKKNSDGPTAAQGGDLGEFKRGTLAKELEDKTFAMKPGEVSDVIRTKQGFIILKATEHTEAGVPPLNKIEPRIQDALYMQKLQPALREYLTKLRDDAFIDIKDGYVDTGASPNETKPIETAAKDDKAKPLKKKKKLGLF
jgi:peptidyl-prolyl cis-trans isomerase SurA